jgi:hypothetical protein
LHGQLFSAFLVLLRYLNSLEMVPEFTGDGQPLPRLRIVPSDQEDSLLSVTNLGLQLLSKWLSERKRPRDWKQQQYSMSVSFLLQHLSRLLRVVALRDTDEDENVVTMVSLAQMDAAYGQQSRLALLRQIAAAQEEVCQLWQAAIQQHEQRSTPEAACQVQVHFELAKSLLQFWSTVDGLWSEAYADADPSEALAAQKPALELAVMLSKVLTDDSHSETIRMVVAVTVRWGHILIHASVAHYRFLLLLLSMRQRGSPGPDQHVCVHLCSSHHCCATLSQSN